jgi:hypothetical protein
MAVMNYLALLAAFILLLELLVVLFIFLAISGGLAFGLYWVRKKRAWASDKVDRYVGLGVGYLRKGLDFVGLPFILAGRYAEEVRVTALAIRERIRRDRRRRLELTQTVAARPVPRPEPVEEPEAPIPLV